MSETSAQDRKHHQKIAQSVSVMGISLAMTMAISLLLRMMMPRILGPEKLGVFYFAESFANLFFSFLPLGLSTYIFRRLPSSPAHTSEVLASMTLLELVMAFCLGLGLCVTLWFGHYDSETRYATLIMGIYAAVLIFSKSVLQNVFLALEEVTLVSRLNVLVKVILVSSCLSVLVFYPSVLLLAGMYLLSELCGLVILLYVCSRLQYFAHPPSLDKLKSILAVSLPFYLAGVLNGVYAEIDTTMLSHLANHKEVGYFGAAYKLIGVFLLLIPLMQSSMSPSLSRAHAARDGSFEQLVTDILRFFLIICLPLSLGVILFGDTIATFLYGSAFAPSFKVIAYLAPVLVMMYLNTFMGTCLNLVSSGHKLAAIFVGSISLNIFLDSLFIPLGLKQNGPGFAAQYVSFSTFLCEGFAFTAMILIFPSKIWNRQLTLRALAIFVPCGLFLYGYDSIVGLDVWRRLALGLLVIPYAFGLKLISIADIKAFWNIVKRRKPAAPSEG